MTTLEPLAPAAEFMGVDPAGAPPAHHDYASALWLLFRHPDLGDLLTQLTGTLEAGAYHQSELAHALRDHDLNRITNSVQTLRAMSATDLARLRLLATIGRVRVPIALTDVACLNNHNAATAKFVSDWTRALAVA